MLIVGGHAGTCVRRQNGAAPTFSYAFADVRLRLALLAALAAAACGGPAKPVKQVKKDLEDPSRRRRSSGTRGRRRRPQRQRRQEVRRGVQREQGLRRARGVGRVPHPRRSRDQGAEAAKTYYDANSSDMKGIRAVLPMPCSPPATAPRRSSVAKQMIEFNGEDPGCAREEGPRAARAREERRRPRRAAQGRAARSGERALSHLPRQRARQARQGQQGRARVPRRAQERRATITPRRTCCSAWRCAARARRRGKSQLDKAIELDPKNGRAYFELGVLYNKQLKQAEAEQALRQGGEARRRTSRCSGTRTARSSGCRRFEEAINAYEGGRSRSAVSKGDGKLGWVLVRRKQYEDAEAVLIQAIRRERRTPRTT